jgi:hypothetical protein
MCARDRVGPPTPRRLAAALLVWVRSWRPSRSCACEEREAVLARCIDCGREVERG